MLSRLSRRQLAATWTSTVAKRFASIDVPVREALNMAIDEKMARDDKVFCIGEEVAQYNGAYMVTNCCCY